MVGVWWAVLYDCAAHFVLSSTSGWLLMLSVHDTLCCELVAWLGISKTERRENPTIRKGTCTTVSLHID